MRREPYKSCTVCEFGYCAPNRCYCGHPECNAYDSYIDIRNQPFPKQVIEAARRGDDASVRGHVG